MTMIAKSFHNNKIIIILLTFLSFCCNFEKNTTINETEFIEIYSRLSIIKEIKLDSLQKEALATNVFIEKQVSKEEINNTIEFYRQNPEKWVIFLQKVRDHIKEIKNKEDKLKSGNLRPVDE